MREEEAEEDNGATAGAILANEHGHPEALVHIYMQMQ